MNFKNAYTKEEADTVHWVSKRFDYFALCCFTVGFALKFLCSDSEIWKILMGIGIPFVVWSNWATLGVSGNWRMWTPFLPELTKFRLKRQAKAKK